MPLHPQLEQILDDILPVVQDFHRRGMFAPHAAFIDEEGKCFGRLLTSDDNHPLSPAQAIDYTENDFSKLAAKGKIQASAIFYHSSGIKMKKIGAGEAAEDFEVSYTADRLYAPADSVDECHMLVVLLEHIVGDSAYLQFQYVYTGEPPSVGYEAVYMVSKPAKVFSHCSSSTTSE